jgi:uncharacterized protein
LLEKIFKKNKRFNSKSAIALTFILVLIASQANILYASEPRVLHYNYVVEVKLPAVAVTSGGNGVVSQLVVRAAYPGSGEIYFSAEPLTMLDSQASARIAVLVASNILGIDYKKYDFMIALKSPSLIIGGPSAGGVMTIGVLAALTNATINDKVAMTGMINPDGTIGPVGGIPEKLRAAAQAGYKIFLIPVGQQVVYDEKIVRQATPLGYITKIERERVNLTELGEKLGVEVKEVSTVEQAAIYFLGLNLTKTAPAPNMSYTPEQEKVFNNWYEIMQQDVNKLLQKINSFPRQALSKEDKAALQKEISEVQYNINQSKTYLNKKMYYTALSYLFRAGVLSETIYIQLYINGNKTKIYEYINNTNTTIINAEKRIEQTRPDTLTRLEAYITATQRIKEAKQLLEKAVNSIVVYQNLLTGEKKTVIQDPESLALAKWRAITSIQWLTYGDIASPPVQLETLAKESEYLMYYGETVLSYYASLGGENTNDYQNLLQLYEDARISYDEQAYPRTIADTISIIASATTGIHQLYNTDLQRTVKAVIDHAQYILSASKYRSAISMGYLESAQEYLKKFEETGSPDYALQALKLSILSSLYAQLVNMLYPENQTSTSITNETTAPTSNTQNQTMQENSTTHTKSLIMKAGEQYWLTKVLVATIAIAVLIVSLIAYYRLRA